MLRCDRDDDVVGNLNVLCQLCDDVEGNDADAQLETVPHSKMAGFSAVTTHSQTNANTNAPRMKIATVDAQTAESAKDNVVSKLTDSERTNILGKCGRRKALQMTLCEIYETEQQMLEVGSSIVTNEGVVTDFVQFFSRSDLEQDTMTDLLPRAHFEKMFELKNGDVTKAMRSHFGLNDEFHVSVYGGLRSRNTPENYGDLTANEAMCLGLNRYFFDDPNTMKSHAERRTEVHEIVDSFDTEKRRPISLQQSEAPKSLVSSAPMCATDEIELVVSLMQRGDDYEDQLREAFEEPDSEESMNAVRSPTAVFLEDELDENEEEEKENKLNNVAQNEGVQAKAAQIERYSSTAF